MKILTHICCAPCFAYPNKRLVEDGHSVVGYWFNPNIHPYMEYMARLEAVKKFAELEDISMVYEEYEFMPYLAQSTQKAAEGRDRCEFCYIYRLTKTASHAKNHGFDGFTTTLLSSHNQKHEKIREIGEKIAKKFQLQFYYEDFRKGIDQAKAITRHYSLYRQRYCGCLFSEWERYRQ